MLKNVSTKPKNMQSEQTVDKRGALGRFEKGNLPKTAFKKGHKSWLEGTKGLVKPNEGTFLKGSVPWNKGKSWSKEAREKMSLAQKGRPAPPTAFKKGQESLMKGRHNIKISGKNHWNWQGGKGSEYLAIRKSLEYKQWRESVFKRDKYTCIKCGDNRGHNLNADHIKPFSLFPELRLVLENGRTLCESCHRKTETWGRGSRKLVWQKNLKNLKSQKNQVGVEKEKVLEEGLY